MTMDCVSSRTTVVVAEDHPLYRAGLVAAIAERPELELLAECSGGHDALEQVILRRPMVALLDMRMPDLDGMAVLEELVRARSRTRVVFLSGYEDGDVVHRAFTAGATGYLSKETDRAEICDAIAAAVAGERIVRLSSVVRDRPGGWDRPAPTFSAREQQVIALTAAGLSAPQIATALGIATTTVKTHLERVYRKLEVTDRAAMVATAIRQGFLTR
jgi:two-component system, NarL family, nitrate/nitrite response regulator NarL